MNYRIYLFFLSFFSLVSCTQPKVKEGAPSHFQRQWIKPNLWISELNDLYNFPYWFDDSLLAKNHIHKICQKTYFENYSTIQNVNLDLLSPDEIKTYYFDDQGKIIRMEWEGLHDNFVYKKKIFRYAADQFDAEIHYLPIITQKDSVSGNNLADSVVISKHSEEQYLQDKKKRNYTSLYNPTKSQRLFFVHNTALTSPITIDTMLSPAPNDVLIFPDFYKPRKIYSVQNKILESNVLEFRYDPPGNLLSYSYRQNSSKKERRVLYSSNGYISGFIEKVFSDNYLIRSGRTIIQQDAIGRPVKIYKNTEVPQMKKVTVFEYQ